MYTSDLVQFTVVGIIVANFLTNIVEFEIMSEDPALLAAIFMDIGFLERLGLAYCHHLTHLSHPRFGQQWRGQGDSSPARVPSTNLIIVKIYVWIFLLNCVCVCARPLDVGVDDTWGPTPFS